MTQHHLAQPDPLLECDLLLQLLEGRITQRTDPEGVMLRTLELVRNRMSSAVGVYERGLQVLDREHDDGAAD